MLYAFAGISSHQVPKVMQLAGLLWKGITDSIPSHVTVLEWVEKCGLSLTRGCMKKRTAEEAYSVIFDNSITVCGQDLHLQLRSSSEHPGHSLGQTDVSVVRMKAGKGWDTEMIKTQLEETIKEEGRKPEYVVSDNGLIMCKAASELELKHHRDISHSFGIFQRTSIRKTRSSAISLPRKAMPGSSPIRLWPASCLPRDGSTHGS